MTAIWIADSHRLAIRAWDRRKDRSQIEHWPAADLPFHWSNVQPSDDPVRISFAIVENQLKQLIGRITLRDICLDESARMGIFLHPNFYGQGYGREAISAFCRHLAHIGMKKLHIDVAADNERAIRAYAGCGFVETKKIQRGGFLYIDMERELCIHSI